jgi:hypothetical protein
MNDHSNTDSTSHAADAALRSQLRAMQPSAAEVAALSDRVLAQWSEQHDRPAVAPTRLWGSGAAAVVLGLRSTRRRLWAGVSAGLVACVVIATVMWAQRPDPTLDDLLQADVLSQMAIGEM